MVWIHGGAWTLGGAYDVPAQMLSAYADVVVVVITYRLAALGFAFGNFGLWDQLEALKWVQNNIAEYGGDRDNVTIFGESAGGWSVESLLSSKHTVGYFHKAIAQSGCLLGPSLENDAQFNALMAFSRKYFNVENDNDLKEVMTSKTMDEIIEFYTAIPMALGGFTGEIPKIRTTYC